jgi:hypothetical protein
MPESNGDKASTMFATPWGPDAQRPHSDNDFTGLGLTFRSDATTSRMHFQIKCR